MAPRRGVPLPPRRSWAAVALLLGVGAIGAFVLWQGPGPPGPRQLEPALVAGTTLPAAAAAIATAAGLLLSLSLLAALLIAIAAIAAEITLLRAGRPEPDASLEDPRPK